MLGKVRKYVAILICALGMVGCNKKIESEQTDTVESEQTNTIENEQLNEVGITEPNVLYVSQNGDADYITISEAVANAKRGTTIIINPGVYDETVNIINKEITLLGTDRETCIILNTTGRYCNSPVVAGGDFTIENLTLKMTVENVGDWEPTYIGSKMKETFLGYALHVDYINTSEANTIQEGKVINCVCYSEAFPAVGCGINKNQRIVFEDCEFIRNTSEKKYQRDKWQGAFIAHASNYDVENQYLELINCKFTSNYGNAANFRMNLAGEKHANLLAINNAFWSDELKSADCVDYEKGNSILNELSYGNSAQCLNAK